MNVTIIGTGRMARGISTRLLEGGNKITLVGHTPGKAEALVEELKAAEKSVGSILVANEETLPGEFVFLAVPYPAAAGLVEHYHDELDGKILVDITNPIDYQSMQSLVKDGSAAEELARLAPVTTRVVKAFNTVFAKTLATGQVQGMPLDVFIAADDDDAKLKVMQLVESGRLRGIDVGPLVRARQLEALGILNVAMQSTTKTNFMSAIKLLV